MMLLMDDNEANEMMLQIDDNEANEMMLDERQRGKGKLHAMFVDIDERFPFDSPSVPSLEHTNPMHTIYIVFE